MDGREGRKDGSSHFHLCMLITETHSDRASVVAKNKHFAILRKKKKQMPKSPGGGGCRQSSVGHHFTLRCYVKSRKRSNLFLYCTNVTIEASTLRETLQS